MRSNTKIIIGLIIVGVLVVFSTNFLPDLIQDPENTLSDEYHYETTFETGRSPHIPNTKPIP